MIRYFSSILFLFVVVGLSAQTINGIVIDDNFEPVISAFVQRVGSEVVTITDIDGKFSIEASKDDFLEISHLSFTTITVEAKDANEIILIQKSINMDAIVIKAHPLDDITHSVVITDNIKRGSQPRNLADLFNDVAGFSIQKRSSMALEPSFRAFKYEEMNIKYDGAAKIVHACPNRMDPITAHVIPEEVRKIEVVKGPYTVRFGQRFGATVNLITKTIIPDKYGLSGSIEGGYESNGNNLVGRAFLQFATKKYDIGVNFENRDFGNYIDGEGEEVSSSFVTQSYSVKLGYNPSRNQRLQFDFRQKFGKDIMHAGLPMDSPKDNSTLMSLDYKITNLNGLMNSLLIKGYYSVVDHLMDNVLRPDYGERWARTPVTSGTRGGKIELGFAPSSKLLIFAGVDADVIVRAGDRFVTIKTNPVGIPYDPPLERAISIWQDAISQDYGVYTEGSLQLTKHITANVGARMDFVFSKIKSPNKDYLKVYGNEVDDIFETTFGGNISFKYLKDDLQLQLAYGRGVRSASMVERYIYRMSIGSDIREYVGNPRLKPEKNHQVELSATKQYENFSIGSGIFYSLIRDYITGIVNSGIVFEGGGGCGSDNSKAPKQFWNVHAYQYGFDAFFKYNILPHFQLTTDIAYTHAHNTSFDEPLAQVGPLSGHVELKWEKDKYWIDFRSRLVANQPRFSVTFDESETPGYILLDLRTGIKPLKNLTIGVSAVNLLDKVYYNHLNFSYKNSDLDGEKIFEPGRSFSAYAKYKF